jgi:GTP-binding protein
MKINEAEFIGSAHDGSWYPPPALPEIAFAGRSNVGKSSLINALARRQKLARTSSEPGRTRSINFYRVNRRMVFADLPGYGYAKVSKTEREQWRALIEAYLEGRQNLRGVVLVMDLRREPSPEDRELAAYLAALGRPVIVAATKADKLGPTHRERPRRALAAGLGLAPDQVTLFSAAAGTGRDELWARLQKLMT